MRVQAWNCSCPAFAFASFPADTSGEVGESEQEQYHISETRDVEESSYAIIGGLSRIESGTPMCKHLLACLLVEHCGLLSTSVQETDADAEQLAGWAGGWGG